MKRIKPKPLVLNNNPRHSIAHAPGIRYYPVPEMEKPFNTLRRDLPVEAFVAAWNNLCDFLHRNSSVFQDGILPVSSRSLLAKDLVMMFFWGDTPERAVYWDTVWEELNNHKPKWSIPVPPNPTQSP